MKPFHVFSFVQLCFCFLGLSFSSLLSAQVQPMPYAQDFESFSVCATNCGTTCNLTDGWLNAADDQTDWIVDQGGTSTNATGPSLDQLPGTTTGHYLYFESSFPCFGGDDTAHLLSPPLDLSGPVAWGIGYWLHMWGSDMGELHVDLSQDGGNSWTLDIVPVIAGDQGNHWFHQEVNLQAWQGDTVWLRWRGISGPGMTSDMALDAISSFAIVPRNTGVTAIPAPSSPSTPGLHNVEAVITNFGTDTLISASVNWSVNGALQTSLGWTGSLPPGDSTASLNLGQANFSHGANTVQAWTSAPNGGTDQVPANDSLAVSVYACNPLNGTYTIGGVGADFPQVSDATFALMNCGVSGPVVMHIQPGLYFDHIELGEIPGVSAAHTVTFDGGDADSTILSWNGGPLIPGGTGGVATVLLWGTDHTTIKNLTLENTATDNAWGVQFRDTASYNLIDSCTIVMLPNGTGDVEGIIASGSFTTGFVEGLHSLHNTLSHNVIRGGDKGIHLEGSPAIPFSSVGNAILHNTIVAPNSYGIFVDNLDSLTVIGNVLTETRDGDGDGFVAIGGLQNFTLTENHFNAQDRGISLTDGNVQYPTENSSRIANNMIHAFNGEGLYLQNSKKLQVFNNTLVGGHKGGRFDDIDSVFMLNNIFFSPNGTAVAFLDPTNSFSLGFDFNLLYTGGMVLAEVGAASYASLSSWQSSNPALNASSLEGDPIFVDPYEDLHLLGPLADGTGLSLLPLDIDGDFRDPFTPDIGADEFVVLLTDASPLALLAPQYNICGDSAQAITLEVRNTGNNPITALPIHATISGDIVDTIDFTYTGFIGPFTTDTVAIGTLNTYAGGSYTLSVATALSGDQAAVGDTLVQTFAAYPVVPVVEEDSIIVCGADTADFFAKPFPGVQYAWYDRLVGGNAVHMGDAFTNPSIRTQTTYYLAYGSIQDSLTTTYASGNGGNGNMFDLVANADIVIDSFQTHGEAGAGKIVEVFYKVGSYVGFENDPLAWIPLGRDTVAFLGTGQAVSIDMGNLSMMAGQTYGIYFTLTNGTLEYSSLSAPQTYTDGVLALTSGAGKSYPFGTTFSPRAWNGSVFYTKAPCSEVRVPVFALADTSLKVNFEFVREIDTLNFTSTATGKDSLSLLWDFGDGSPLSTEANPTHVYTSSGSYTVCLIATDACGSDTLCREIPFVKTDIEGPGPFQDLQVFPNPTAGQFVLRGTIPQPLALKVSLTDPVGRLLFLQEAQVSGFYEQDFDLSHLPPGIYLLRLASEGRSRVYKLIHY